MARVGRPALPEGEKRVRRGINLSPQAWDCLEALSKTQGLSQNRVVEQLILGAMAVLSADVIKQRSPYLADDGRWRWDCHVCGGVGEAASLSANTWQCEAPGCFSGGSMELPQRQRRKPQSQPRP